MYKDLPVNSSQEVVEKYAPMVKRIAHHLSARLPSEIQLDDLLQSGMVGLLEAAGKYDASKGASFETYAGIRVRGAMLDEVRKGEWAPRSVHKNTRTVTQAIRQVENRNGRDAEPGEVAKELGVSLSDYNIMLQDMMCSRLFSFEDLISEGDCFGTNDPDPATLFQKNVFTECLIQAIDGLPEREKLVLSLYYDEELNLKEIGQVLGVSESRVSQVHSQAALRLRARLKDWMQQQMESSKEKQQAQSKHR